MKVSELFQIAQSAITRSRLIGALMLVLCPAFEAEAMRELIPKAREMSLLPLAFTRNLGQWDERALFQAKGNGVTMWFTPEGVYYHLLRFGALSKEWELQEYRDEYKPQLSDGVPVEQRVVKATLVGSNPSPEVIPENEMEYKCNWFIGNDPEKWRTDVPNYTSLVYKEVYPGIDVHYRGNGSQIEHDFIISPGANPSLIQMRYDGAQSVSIDNYGNLVIVTDFGELVERIPKTFQEIDGRVEPVSCCYELLHENTVQFLLDEGHNPGLALVIDPTLNYSTYLGGSNAEGVQAIAVGDSDNVYAFGYTWSTDFPTLSGYDATHNGGTFDLFVTKFATSGNSLVYSTYVGGSGQDGGGTQNGNSIAVDASGNAYFTEISNSANYPTVNAYDATYNGTTPFWEVVVTKLNAAGNALVWSTFLGGIDDDIGSAIAVDGQGNAVVVGFTHSVAFPTFNALDPAHNGFGVRDGFVTKFDASGTSLHFSTFVNLCTLLDVALDGAGNVYVAGWGSTGFPVVNAYDATEGGVDAVALKLDSSGTFFRFSTFLGGSDEDYGTAIAVDSDSTFVVAGKTRSTDFPTANAFDGTLNATFGGYDAFVTKFSVSGTSLVFSTYLGGVGIGFQSSEALGVAIDATSRVHVTGYTECDDFPTQDAFDATHNGATDAFATTFSAAGNTLDFSTFLGGTSGENGRSIEVDGSGNIVIGGFTFSSDFPTVNAHDASLGGSSDGFIAEFGFSQPDGDGDGEPDETDNCPLVFNPDQADTDGDTEGNACDTDDDNDGDLDLADNCPLTFNPTQRDGNANSLGDECDTLWIIARSPVDFVLVSPDGQDSIGMAVDRSLFNTIGSNAIYDTLTDFGVGPNGVIGEADDAIYVVAPVFGEWSLKIFPEPDADTADDYFLGIRDPGGNLTGIRDPGGNIIGNVKVTGTGDGTQTSVHDTVVTNSVPPQGMYALCPILVTAPRRGDINNDRVFDVVDVVGTIGVAFRGAALPSVGEVADVNGDSVASDVVDVVTLVTHVFRGGPQPAP